MSDKHVYVIEHAGRYWRKRHGHARSGWIASLELASLYRRSSDARRAASQLEGCDSFEIWEVQMSKVSVVHRLESPGPAGKG